MAHERGRPLTTAEREQRRQRDRERLEQAIGELSTSEGWARWLRARAVLHGYSLHNTLLIAHQCAARGIDPTYVAGFRAWLKLGRSVRKGQRGIAIWVPMRVKPPEQDDGEEPGQKRLRFRVAHVFDVSQTAPLPDVEPAPLAPPAGGQVEGDSHAHLIGPLEELADRIGFTVLLAAELPGAARGLCRRSERRIEVLQTLELNGRVAVLIHELCHALLGETDTRLGYAAEEIVVEAATYVACSAAGLATDIDSVPYIAGWAGDDEPREAVHRAAQLIDALARQIDRALATEEDDNAPVAA